MHAVPGDEVYHPPKVELSPVNRWRQKVFVAAGFGPENAELLAVSSADVHKTIRMIQKGCSLELALEILL